MGIVLATLVIKAVREFMPDHHADGAVVHRVIHQLAVKRRLQDARGEVDIIHGRAVVGVNGWRSHAPILAVRGPLDLIVLPPHLERAGALHVARVIVGFDLDTAVITPLVGIANVVDHGVELLISLLLRRFRHPGRLVEVLLHCILDGPHQLHGALLAFGTEGAVYI